MTPSYLAAIAKLRQGDTMEISRDGGLHWEPFLLIQCSADKRHCVDYVDMNRGQSKRFRVVREGSEVYS